MTLNRTQTSWGPDVVATMNQDLSKGDQEPEAVSKENIGATGSIGGQLQESMSSQNQSDE